MNVALKGHRVKKIENHCFRTYEEHAVMSVTAHVPPWRTCVLSPLGLIAWREHQIRLVLKLIFGEA